MKLVKSILFVQLSCICQALRNTSTQINTTHVQTGAEEEQFKSDPYVHRLSGKCNFTLRRSINESAEDVALTSDSAALLLDQICQGLGCGRVFHVNDKNISTANASCFHGCLFQDGRLQNCSQSVGRNCTAIAGAVCGHQAVRLAGGPDRCAGRVELWRDGLWGTVCDDGWDLRDADVACAQVDCGYAISVWGQGGQFPPGSGPVHLDELNCTGREDNLWTCDSAPGPSDCGHKEDAGVVCSEMRAIRLSGGLDRCSGKVEVHRNGSWGTVCDNCLHREMASRVCSMLGCGPQPTKYSQFVPPLAHNNGSLWYYHCGPSAASLWQCTEFANSKHLCADSRAAGVVCNGSLGFPNVTTVSDAAVTTVWTTAPEGVITVDPAQKSLPPAEFLILVCVSLVLLVVLITNTLLCCHYRSRHAFLLQQTRSGSRPFPEHHNKSPQDNVHLVKVTANSTPTDAPSNPRYLWTQLSSVDSTSVDTDYEQYEPNEPFVPLSTFRNSQRHRTDGNSLMKPSGLHSLFEEVPEPTEEVMGEFVGCHVDSSDPQYARVSKISVDSFDTSSTSSGECYQNSNNYVIVTPDPDLEEPPVVSDPLKLHQLPSAQARDPHSSDDENEGPIYSPVSPDQNSLSEDDYDDVGCLE